MAKILFINLPAHDYVNPTIPLTRELIVRGHEITYLITDEFQGIIAATGADVVCYEKTKSKNSFLRMAGSTRAAYEKAMVIGGDYDCIIYEMAFTLGKKLGDVLGKPAAAVHSGFALNKDIANGILRTRQFPLKLVKIKGIRKLLTRHFLGTSNVKDDDILAEVTENVAELNIVNTSRKFQIKNDEFDDSKYRFVGPFIDERSEHADISFSEIKGPLIFISMGTTNTPHSEFYKKGLLAFQKNDVTVIMEVGKKINIVKLGYGIGNFGALPANYMVYPSVPSAEVLQHADLFITQGEMNSVSEAIFYGVPILVIPQQGIEQVAVAKRIEDLGLGEKINFKDVTSKKIRKTAVGILENPSYKEAMNSMSEDIKAAGGCKRAADEIENYIKATSNLDA